MTVKLSSDELHQFKTAVLAAQKNKGMKDEKETGSVTEIPPPPDNNEHERQDEDDDPYVNYILHLKSFFAHAKKDDRLKISHFSLYLSLFDCWNRNHFKNPFPVIREQVMQLSKIGSANTYSRSIQWLHTCGYIVYRPPRRVYKFGMVSINILKMPTSVEHSLCIENDTQEERKSDTHARIKSDTHMRIKSATGPVAKVRHNYYNKHLNNETETKQAHAQKKLFNHEKETPTLEATTNWFTERGQTAQEARKFFYHYESIAWTLSGQPIVNWKAIALKWIVNIKKTKNGKTGNHFTAGDKDYSKPL